MARLLSLLLAALLTVAALRPAAAQERPRNVILFVSDGTGPATFTMARDYSRAVLGKDRLALDEILVGSIQTRSSSARVTDSAAGATAFATGEKSYNGAISVDTLRRPIGTILEAAEARGMATGLVATSRVTHATPAAFAAHVPSRAMEDEIAEQMMTSGVDVVFGGGRRHFLPEAAGGRRGDGRDLLAEARRAGYTVATDRAAFDALGGAPAVALLSDDHLAMEIDRDADAEPSIAEMTVRAIELLDGDADGFFLMVEGSRIDHASHGNDPVGTLHDALAYDRAVAAALEWAARDGETLVVSTSDHETGGLSLGRDIDGVSVYDWKPEAIARVTASGYVIADELRAGADPLDVLRRRAGIDDPSDEERVLLTAAETLPGGVTAAVLEIINRRAVIGWTTHGHTAVDVGLFAFGPGRDAFVGQHDNTDVGRAVAELLRLDLPAATARLRADGTH